MFRIDTYALIDPNDNGEQELSFELWREFINELDARQYFNILTESLPASGYYVELLDDNKERIAWYGIDPEALNQE